ncbi:MAG: hypothetical protein ACPGTU_03600 [Myxococcota bacterium]
MQSDQPPFQARSHYIRGKILAAQGDTKGAQAAYAQARIFDPNEPRILMAMGHSAMNAGDIDAARGHMRNAALLALDDPEPWVVHGRLEMAFGDKVIGREALEKAALLGDPWVARASLIDDSLRQETAGDDESLLKQWSETQTSDPVELRRRGSLRVRAGDSVGGMDDYLEAMNVAQRDLSIVGPLLQAAIQGRQEAYGLIKIERWLAEEPTATAGWLAYALLCDAVGDHIETVRALEQVEALGVELGNKSAQILGTARKKIESPPQTPKSRPPPLADPISRSLRLMEEGRWDDAERVVIEQQKHSPQDARLMYIMAQIFLERDGPAAAQPWVEKVLALQPGYSPALNLWAWIHCEQGLRLDEAKKNVQEALRVQPRVGGYWDTLGRILYLQGHHFESQLILERAVRLDPDDEGIQRHLLEVRESIKGGGP